MLEPFRRVPGFDIAPRGEINPRPHATPCGPAQPPAALSAFRPRSDPPPPARFSRRRQPDPARTAHPLRLGPAPRLGA